MQNHQTQNIDIQVYMYMEEERKRDRGARMKDQIVKLSSTGTKLGSHILFSFFLYQQTLYNLSFTFMLSKQLQLPPPCLFGRMDYSPERSYKSIIFFFYCLNLGQGCVSDGPDRKKDVRIPIYTVLKGISIPIPISDFQHPFFKLEILIIFQIRV